MSHLYIVSVVENNDTNDGHPSCVGVFHSKEEAEAYIHDDMKAYCDNLSSNTEDETFITDFYKMEIKDSNKDPVCMWSLDEIDGSDVSHDKVKKAEKVLIDNGIAEDEASTVLQAVGYALMDTELYPEDNM